MALVLPGMKCPICGKELGSADDLVGFSGNIAEPDDPLSFFNDSAFHRECFETHPLAAQAERRWTDIRRAAGFPPDVSPVFLSPGEGELLPGRGRELRVRYEGREYEVLEFDCEPGFGPIDPHVHDDHTDSFFVLEGEVEFTIGHATVRAGPGTWVAAPPGTRHGFSVPGPGRARFLNIHAPGVGFIDSLRPKRSGRVTQAPR